MSTTNKVTPEKNELEMRDEFQEIMAIDPKSSTLMDSSPSEIQDYLKNLKLTLISKGDESPYKIFLTEYENFTKDISLTTLETFKENIKKRLSSDDIKFLAQRDLRLMNVQMPILNFFAYFYDLEMMAFLFELFSATPLEIFPDFRDKDLLEIAIDFKNRSMIDLIIQETTKNPPSYGSWKKLTGKIMKTLFQFQIDKLGSFMDSRVFPIQVDANLRFSGFFFYTNSIVVDKFPLSDYDIKEKLTEEIKDPEGLYQTTEFRFLDIKNYVADKNFLLSEINDNFPGDNDIYGSNVISAMAYHHWLTYGYVMYLIKLVIFALEFVFFFKITDYLRSDPSLPNSTGAIVVVYLVVFYLIIILEFHTEFTELRNSGLRRYISSDDNIIDVFAIGIYSIMVIFYSLQYHYVLTSFPDGFYDKKLIVQGFFYFFMALRILWMFQVFPGMGFYIRMIAYAIRYIFLFFWFFILLIVVVCFSFAGVAGNEGLTQNTSWNFGNFYRVFKAALGDSGDFMQIIDPSLERYGYIYFLYFVVAIILQIIMLNIVITILADGYADLKNYRKEFSNKTIISSIVRLKSSAVITEIKKTEIKGGEIKEKLHYRWYESVFFYIKFIFASYFCNKILTRQKFKGEFFVYSYLTNSCQEKVPNKEFYLNKSYKRVTGTLDEFEDKGKILAKQNS